VDGEVRVLPLEELRVELEAAGTGPLVLSTVTDEYEAVDVRPEVEEESELTSAIDIIEEAPRTETAAPSEIATTPTNGDEAAAEAPHKPHRRRGRRGGRRNRAGRERGETNGGGGDGGTAPPEA
jgi:hypothetical protein